MRHTSVARWLLVLCLLPFAGSCALYQEQPEVRRLRRMILQASCRCRDLDEILTRLKQMDEAHVRRILGMAYYSDDDAVRRGVVDLAFGLHREGRAPALLRKALLDCDMSVAVRAARAWLKTDPNLQELGCTLLDESVMLWARAFLCQSVEEKAQKRWGIPIPVARSADEMLDLLTSMRQRLAGLPGREQEVDAAVLACPGTTVVLEWVITGEDEKLLLTIGEGALPFFPFGFSAEEVLAEGLLLGAQGKGLYVYDHAALRSAAKWCMEEWLKESARP